MKRIYIAGKVSNLPEQEVLAKFGNAQSAIELLGFEVVNPMTLVKTHIKEHFLNQPLTDAEIWELAIKVCIKAMIDCDGVVVLPCWNDSKAAKIERQLADDLDMQIFSYTSFGLKVLKANLL